MVIKRADREAADILRTNWEADKQRLGTLEMEVHELRLKVSATESWLRAYGFLTPTGEIVDPTEERPAFTLKPSGNGSAGADGNTEKKAFEVMASILAADAAQSMSMTDLARAVLAKGLTVTPATVNSAARLHGELFNVFKQSDGRVWVKLVRA